MASLEKYSSYKEKHFPLEVRMNVSDCIRIFLWTLVQKLQQDHLQSFCRVMICKDSISVKENVAYLTAEKVDFTEKSAKENYLQLLRFMKEDVFQDIEGLPDSLNHFMKLLEDPNPLQYQYLLGRHFGILPSRIRFQVLKDLIQRPLALRHMTRMKIYSVIDQVAVQSNWENCFISQDSNDATAVKKYLEKNFNSVGSLYETVCPACRTYFLLRFMRNCLLHLGFAGVSSEDAVYGVEDADDVFVEAEDANRGFSLNSVVDCLVDLYSSEVTEMLYVLHLNGLLKYLCINPSDCIPEESEEEKAESEESKESKKEAKKRERGEAMKRAKKRASEEEMKIAKVMQTKKQRR